MCGSALYYRGENCLGSVGSCVSRRFKVSRECKGKAHFVPIQYENPHVAGLHQITPSWLKSSGMLRCDSVFMRAVTLLLDVPVGYVHRVRIRLYRFSRVRRVLLCKLIGRNGRKHEPSSVGFTR